MRAIMGNEMTGVSVQDMDRWLIKTGSVIAGSVVVGAILDKSWRNIDIDIWCPSSFDLEQSGFPLSKIYKHNRSTEINKDYTRLAAYVRSIKTFEDETRIPVQVMTLKHGISVPQVVLSFDIVATQFMYDGRTIVATNDQALTDLNAKRIVFSPITLAKQTPFEWLRTIVRVGKYASRGFTVPNDEWTKVIVSLGKGIITVFNKNSGSENDGIAGMFTGWGYDNPRLNYDERWNNLATDGLVPQLERRMEELYDNYYLYTWRLKMLHAPFFKLFLNTRNDWEAEDYDPRIHTSNYTSSYN